MIVRRYRLPFVIVRRYRLPFVYVCFNLEYVVFFTFSKSCILCSQADEKEIDTVKIKIETAIAAVNQGNSMSC